MWSRALTQTSLSSTSSVPPSSASPSQQEREERRGATREEMRAQGMAQSAEETAVKIAGSRSQTNSERCLAWCREREEREREGSTCSCRARTGYASLQRWEATGSIAVRRWTAPSPT